MSAIEPDSRPPLLDARGISYSVRGRSILNQVSLSLETGEVVGLIGPNGAGKSTLLKCLMGFLPFEGDVLLSGEDLHQLNHQERARRISYVSQQGPEQLSFTSLEVVEMGGYGQSGLFGRSRYDDCDQALRSLEYVGMAGAAGQNFATLSGGERQLVLFARVLLQDAPVLLLDEPTSNLDIGHERTVLEMLDELRREGKAAIIAIHNLNLAAEYCDRLVLLDDGEVRASGLPEEVIDQDLLEQAYRTRINIERSPATGSLAVTPLRKYPRQEGAGVHIIGGAGSGVNLTRMLLRAGFYVTGGVAHRLDSDARLWDALGIEMVAVDAFDEIDDDAHRRAGELIDRADWTVLADFPIGRGNLRNLELASRASRLIIMDGRERSFYAEGGRQLFESIQPEFRAGSAEEVLRKIRAAFGE
jgi:iron complex transport system ATP-binding protein